MSLNFLLLGAGRGGTSLLAGLLDQHSELEMGFERFSVNTLLGKSLKTWRSSQILSHRCQEFRKQCDSEAQRYKARRWGNKITTEQLFGLEDHNLANPEQPQSILDYFFLQCLAGIPIIFILRDGRSCVESKVARTGQSYELACKRWLYSIEVFDYLSKQHSSVHFLRFEDLLEGPEDELRKLCAFLELDFEPAMLAGSSNKKMPAEYQQSTIDKTKLKKPELEAQYLQLINPGLLRAGYL